MTEKTRRLVLTWVGYPCFAVFIFFFFLYMTFPCEKLKNWIEHYISATGEMEVRIGELSMRPLLGLAAEQVTIKLKSKQPENEIGASHPSGGGAHSVKAKPSRIFLDKVVVKSGLFALLGGGVDVSFSLVGFGGEVHGSYEMNKKTGWALKTVVEKLNLEKVPYVIDSVGLPINGSFSANIDLSVPQDRWANAAGTVEIDCEECSIGDGKAKLKIPGNPLLAMGITLPRVQLGRLGGRVKIEKGIATLENVSAQSPDVEIGMEGNFNLQNPLKYSIAQAYIRFKISSELKKRDPKFELLENGLSKAKRADGFYGMLLQGPLKAIKAIPSSAGPGRELPGVGRPRFGVIPQPRLLPGSPTGAAHANHAS